MMNKPHAWTVSTLESMGYFLHTTDPEEVQITPWSKVYRYTTSQGTVFLKIVPAAISLEADIIRILHDQFKANVPVVIASNQDLNCFLMKDAGVSLRGILKSTFDIELLYKAINQFASLQIAVANRINILLDKGVPDWQPSKMPDLYIELLTHKDLLIEDGLSEHEFKDLERLIPIITELCHKLSGYAVKPTLVQPDCNDNNTLIEKSSGRFTTIDLGEIAISHPFFSLYNFLFQVKKHYGLTDTDNSYAKIKEIYFDHFTDFETPENLQDIFKLAQPLWFIYGALAGHRLMNACGKSTIMSYQHGKFCRDLKQLIVALN